MYLRAFRFLQQKELKALNLSRTLFVPANDPAFQSGVHQKVLCDKCEKFYCYNCWKQCPKCN